MARKTEAESPKQTKARRPYQKPAVERVELIPEEALLTGCKQPSVCSGRIRRPDHS